MPTLLGSFTNTYLPSGIFMHMSVTVRTILQPLAKETLSWAAKSVGRIEAVLKMTCRVLSRGCPREIYLHQKDENRKMEILALKEKRSGHSNLPNLHELSARKDTLYSPLGEFAAVVLHLRCNNGTTLRI